jgi:hypothetical protein
MKRHSSIAITCALLLGGCYYEIRDVRNGAMYYSPDWVAADGYRGPLTFTDHQGHKRRVEDSHVVRLSKRDYEEMMRELAAAQAAQQPQPSH